jgi:cell division protein FtsI/penicillin-binding protein 2/cell division protein FtsW (lipid II flippase)
MLSFERSAQPRNAARSRPGAERTVTRPRVRPDFLAVIALFVLAGLGLANLRALGSASLYTHQVVTLAVGVVLFVGARWVHASALRWLGRVCYGVGLVLLIAVGAIGSSDYGARRWLTVGSFTVQPSELVKVGILLVLAEVLGSGRHWSARFGLALVIAAPPIGLVLLEPDLSTASVLMLLTAIMLVLGRIPLRVIVSVIGAVVVCAPFGERLLQPYQQERLHAFLSGSRSSSGSGWTILQAHIALAWGGVKGQAGGLIHEVLALYLPARETDLAFASLVEQWGIRAGVLAVLAACVLVWRFAVAGRHARTPQAALFAAGFAALIGVETAISVAANLGLIPTAGVPFPLLSFGGTAVAVHCAMAGMVLRLRAEGDRHQLWLAPSWSRTHPRLTRMNALAVSTTLIVMLGFAVSLQRADGERLRAAGITQMTRCITIPAPRGTITDRHGVPLATNIARDQIWVAPGLVTQGGLHRVAAAIHRSARTLSRRATTAARTGPFVTIATVAPDLADSVRSQHLRGVAVIAAPQRHYPEGALLGPVLGWYGIATPADLRRWPALVAGQMVGRAGLEQTYDPVLRGLDGRLCVYVDPSGVPVAMAPGRRAVPGRSVRLTLDLGLQRAVTNALAKAIRTGGGDLGGAVAMDPRTGQVLALASLPSYDNGVFGPPVHNRALDRLARRPGHPMLEHATQVAAPPGSTFKLVVASSDLAHRAVPADLVVPTGGSWTLDGHVFHNWSALPPQDLRQAIAWSNDVYFYKLAWALGPRAMIQTARALGVGRPTGIDLPGESSGFLGTPGSVHRIGADWYPGSTVLLGIGQGYLTTTPLQSAVWTAAVATGSVVTPHLGLAAEDRNGRLREFRWPAPKRLPFARLLGPVRAGMRAAVTSGTAMPLASLPLPAGGKTGTAEDPTAPGAGVDSWLSAVAPIHSPVVEVTAFIHGGNGGEISTEPVRASLAYFLTHRGATLTARWLSRHRSGHGRSRTTR